MVALAEGGAVPASAPVWVEAALPEAEEDPPEDAAAT